MESSRKHPSQELASQTAQSPRVSAHTAASWKPFGTSPRGILLTQQLYAPQTAPLLRNPDSAGWQKPETRSPSLWEHPLSFLPCVS